MEKWLKFTGGFVGGLIVLSFFFWIGFLNHVSVNEVGVAYDSINGKITIQKTPGWYVTPPTVRVAHLSTLPMKVTIPSHAAIINMKIVRFRVEGVQELIELQGFSYDLGQSLENILLGYAFSGKNYPFMEILQSPEPEVVTPRQQK